MRKISKGLSVFMVVLSVLVSSFFINFESNAATSYTLTSKFPQPYADEVQSGYLNLAIENYWSARDLCTIAWQVVPIVANQVITVNVAVNQSSITFRASVGDGSFYVNLWELQPSGYASLLYSGLVANSYERSTSWNGGTIVGASVFGRCSKFSYYGGSYVPSVTAIWSEQGTQIAKYNEILNSLNSLNSTLGGKLDSLITEVHNVFLQVDSAEDTLARIRELMVQYYPQFQEELEAIVEKVDLMIGEQKETNSWLKKIYDKICEALGLEGEESTEDLQGKDEAAEMDKQEEELLNDDSVNTDDLELNLDTNSSGTIWAMVDNLVTSNEKVFTTLISVLTLGIVALILGR